MFRSLHNTHRYFLFLFLMETPCVRCEFGRELSCVCVCVCVYSHVSRVLVALSLLYRSDKQHSIGLLWTSDQPVAETST